MSRETTEVLTFNSEDEARSHALETERKFWAYDASARVWWSVDEEVWKVTVRMRDSCD